MGRKKIFTTIISIIIVAGLITSIFAIFREKKNSNNDISNDSALKTNTFMETLDDVSRNFSFLINSPNKISKIEDNIIITNQFGQNIVPNISEKNGTEYEIIAPNKGYTPGYTYLAELKNEEVTFVDAAYCSRRSITFTIYRKDVIDVVQKKDVVNIETTQAYIEENGTITMDDGEISKNSLTENKIIILPIYDDYGFVVQKAYKIKSIENNTLFVEEPSYDEVFDNFNVKGNFDAKYSSEYIKQINMDEVIKEIKKNEDIQYLSSKSESQREPQVKITIEIESACVCVKYEVKFPGFFNGMSFIVKGKTKVFLGAKADINITDQTFDVGTIMGYSNTFEFILEFEYEPTKEDEKNIFEKNIKKLKKTFLQKKSNEELKIPAFNMLIPTPIPILLFEFEVKIAFTLELKAEIKSTICDEVSVKVGTKKDSSGVSSYYNKSSSREVNGVELCGSITAKFGLEVSFSGNSIGILKAGVTFEIGIYMKLAGFVKVNSFSEYVKEKGQEIVKSEDSLCHCLYFEVGIYSSLSLFAKLDFITNNLTVKSTILEVELPIFSIGRTQMITIDTKSENIVFDDNGTSSLPCVTINTQDMFTGEISSKEISKKEIKDYFKVLSNTTNFVINDDNDLVIINKYVEEFEDYITYELREWQSIIPETEVELGTLSTKVKVESNRGFFHYEFGALDISLDFCVVKEPVKVDSFQLSYERITDDEEYEILHPELEESDLSYNCREDINDIADYQIGRLVKVVPTFSPANASYKTLDYCIEKGQEFIVDGVDGIKTYEKNGITYAIFRIIYDEKAIGNVDGEIDLLKEIKLGATLNGYSGKYISNNKGCDSTKGIFASSIPAEKYDLSMVADGKYYHQTEITNGASISFEIEPLSIKPKNATRGILGTEKYSILSGPADIINNTIIVREDAQVGDQIILYSELSKIEKKYYLNVVKTNVDNITLSSSHYEMLPGESAKIDTKITGNNGENPTLNEPHYIIVSGNENAKLIYGSNQSDVTLQVNDDAKVGDNICVMAVIDGKKSNVLEFEICKTGVEKLLINSTKTVLEIGEEITFNNEVYPTNATYKSVKYYIVDGKNYAILDEVSGVLIAKNSCFGGETIKVIGIADGVQSNTVNITINKQVAKYVRFPVDYEMIRDNQEIELDAFVNPDASNKNIIYTIQDGSTYATISGNTLSLLSNIENETEIIIRATLEEDKTKYAEKTFVIYSKLEAISIDGIYGFVKMFAGDEKKIVVTDDKGQVIDNQNVEFSALNSFGYSSYLANIDENGNLSIRNNITKNETDLQVTVLAKYKEITLELYVDIIIPPQRVSIVCLDNKTTNATIIPNEKIELLIKTIKAENGLDFDNLEIVVEGNVDARIKTEIGDYGIVKYKIIAQAKSEAMKDDIATIRIRYYIYGIAKLSQSFTITIGQTTEKVEIINVPAKMNIGESIILECQGYPKNANYTPNIYFTSIQSRTYAILDSKTCSLTINNDERIVGQSIYIKAIIEGIYSEEYRIVIGNDVKGINIKPDTSSIGVEYIDKLGVYTLNPMGEFIISTELIGGEKETPIHYCLDKIGQKYLSLDGTRIIVKDVEINSLINATLVAYSDNGVISNTIVIHVPIVVKTINDWKNIQNNVEGYYVLANDIDFIDTEYIPISKFGGIINGNGFTLKNISCNLSSKNPCFGIVEENYGIITNLNVRQLNIEAMDKSNVNYIGGIAAKNYGNISNCIVSSGSGNRIHVQNSQSFTGVICAINSGTIENCKARIYIISYGCASGIAAVNFSSGIIKNCENLDTIAVSHAEQGNKYNGIVSRNENGIITGCKNYGQVYERSSNQYIEN